MKFISDNKRTLFSLSAVSAAAGINVFTAGGFAIKFIAHAVMGLAISATAQFAIAGAASAAMILLAVYGVYHLYKHLSGGAGTPPGAKGVSVSLLEEARASNQAGDEDRGEGSDSDFLVFTSDEDDSYLELTQ